MSENRENYNRIVLVSDDQITDITYEECILYMASPEKYWRYIAFFKGHIIHRLDGPALEYPDGDKAWWVNGNLYETEQEYLVAVAAYKAKHGL